jgi:hypothetical protein
VPYIVQCRSPGAQDAPLGVALCGGGRCDGALITSALAPVLPALLPAEAAEVAEAVAALRPAPPDAAQLLLLIASRCLKRTVGASSQHRCLPTASAEILKSRC